MTKKVLTVLSLLLLFLSFQAIAADKDGIELKAVSEVDMIIKNEQGKEEVIRVAAAEAEVKPGDTVIFTTYYSNKGKETASDIVINNPMPENMLYIGGSASGKDTVITFSIDKGKTYNTPDKLKVTGKDGKERTAEPSEYTNIRWAMKKDIKPGEEGFVVFKAKVE
ncbi:MAG: DUF11 domain-containing protein [Nitrospirae bacterium]|nr:DUF11 domain-containing protein [Nitrospirota bacterium]